MVLKKEINRTYAKVDRKYSKMEREYVNLTMKHYTPLFKKQKAEAIKKMNSEGIFEMNLGGHSGDVVFNKNGKFYDRGREVFKLRDLADIYQQNLDFGKTRSESTTPIHQALHYALRDFQENN